MNLEKLTNCDDVSIFDVVAEPIFVIDAETYELLYINFRGCEVFDIEHKESYLGKKCYEVLLRRGFTCRECGVAKDKKPGVNHWSLFLQHSKHYYDVKDHLFVYRGRLARLEVAIDITGQVKQKEDLQAALALEMAISEAVRILYSQKNVSEGLNKMFAFIGSYLQAETFFMYEKKGHHFSIANEWKSEAAQSPKMLHQNFDFRTLPEFWKDTFLSTKAVILLDVHELKRDHPDVFRYLLEIGVYNYILMPLIIDSEIVGFFGMDNILDNRAHNLNALLKTLSYFITASMTASKNKELLEQLSFTDAMTGVANRNAFNREVEFLKSVKSPVGVIFVDLNGLKRVNDEEGHTAGDKMIISVTDTLSRIFRKHEIYRVGGDEFLILAKGISQNRFNQRVEVLREKFSDETIPQVSIGSAWCMAGENVAETIADADSAMYIEKRRYYEGKK